MSASLSSRRARLGALCGALSGLLIALPALVEAFIGETAGTSVLIGLSPALSLPLLVELHRWQSPAGGRFADTAYLVNLLGLGLFGGAAFASNLVLFYFEEEAIEEALTGPTIPVLIGSGVVFAVGSALFGASMIRARMAPGVPAWGYAVALPLLAFLAPVPESVFTSAVHLVAGAALVWLAAGLWQSATATGRGPRTAVADRVPA
jgi:hypothetical protein